MVAVSRMIDHVEERMAGIVPRRVAIGTVTVPFWLFGRAVGITARAVWAVTGWIIAATVTGFREGFRGIQ